MAEALATSVERSAVPPELTAVILAGGQARRMGGLDKGLLRWHGQALIEHVLARIAPQVQQVWISANRHQETYAAYGQVVSDAVDLPRLGGPLVGLATVLRAGDHPWWLCVPCDTPLLPRDLALRLWQGLAEQNTRVAVAVTNGRLQPTCLLLHRGLQPDLVSWLQHGGRKVSEWLQRHDPARVHFDDPIAFRNFNHPGDLQS